MQVLLYITFAVLAVLGVFAPMATGTGKPRGRPKGSKGKRRSGLEIMRDHFAAAVSSSWRILRDATNADGPDYVEEIGNVAEGLIRAKRDTKRFGFFNNPAAVAERVKALRDRANRIEEVAGQVQRNEIVRSDAVNAADNAFKAFGEAIAARGFQGQEVNVEEIFSDTFSPELRDTLSTYAETPDPFAGTDDETEDSEESENDDDENA